MGNAIRLHIYDDPCCSIQQFPKKNLALFLGLYGNSGGYFTSAWRDRVKQS